MKNEPASFFIYFWQIIHPISSSLFKLTFLSPNLRVFSIFKIPLISGDDAYTVLLPSAIFLQQQLCYIHVC